jgi:hypothetical protein
MMESVCSTDIGVFLIFVVVSKKPASEQPAMRKPSILLGKMGSGNECDVPAGLRQGCNTRLCGTLRR